jgi:hypothetical protein
MPKWSVVTMSGPRKRLTQDADSIDVEAAITIVLISPFPDDHDQLGTALSTRLWTIDGAANWVYTAHTLDHEQFTVILTNSLAREGFDA